MILTGVASRYACFLKENIMESFKKVPQGLLELIENKYNVKVLDSHYVIVDERFKRYNMMLFVKFSSEMEKSFNEKYGSVNSAMHVAWDAKDEGIKFYAEIGNNILLLWDTLSEG